MKVEMEFSLAKAIDRMRPSVSNRFYIRLSSTPSKFSMVPGIGQTVKMPSNIVALPQQHRSDGIHIKKKNEEVIIYLI